MGIFDFLKPKKIQDDFFGELSFSSGKNALFEGEKIFLPTGEKIGLTIISDGSTPTQSQRDFYEAIENNYNTIKEKSIPLIIKEFNDWQDNFETKNFDIEFAIESIKIPDLNKSPINWEICYTTIHDKDHWIIINLLSFEPISVMIDG
jgi:hypothetical protein